MKILSTLLLCILAFGYAQAQDVETTQAQTVNFKQSAGDKNLELQFDPGAIFNASNVSEIFSNGLGIRFRMFKSESIAYRLNLNISYANTSTVMQDFDNNIGDLELKDKSSMFGISLQPGIEKHFAGTKRLSPYIGGALNLAYQSNTFKSEYQIAADVYTFTIKNSGNTDGLTFGVAGIAGADFYFAKNVYLGVELIYGLNYFTAFTEKRSSNEQNIDDTETRVGKSNIINFQPSALGMFRIGFLF